LAQFRDLAPEDAAFAESWGGRIGLEVIHGNREAAHRQVDAAFEEHAKREFIPLLKTPLSQIGVDVLTTNSLERLGILNVDEFLHANMGNLITVPQLGPNRILTAMQSLLKHTIKQCLELEAR
jgi:hypothetical protein